MSKKVNTIDFSIYILPIILFAVGVSVIYSLVFSSEDTILALKQGISGGIGIMVMIFFSLINYRSLKGFWWVFYILAILLLIYVDFFGSVSGGAMRWINLGFFNIQPSEIAKLSIIVVLAAYFSGRRGKINFVDYIWSFIIFLPPFFLILKEPDLGTAIVVFLIYLMILISSGPSKKQLVIIFIGLFLMLSVFLLSVFSIKPFQGVLKQYQRDRVFTFMDPGRDPYGQGYNVKQAQIAIGSGGLFGKGLGRGSQSQLEFLPKPHTDFIFAGTGEALGFLGASLIIILFLILSVRLFAIAQTARDNFGFLFCLGAGAMFMFQAMINIGMNLGLSPVTGIPLPFMSYGGSSLVISFMMIGIAQSVYINHKKIDF